MVDEIPWKVFKKLELTLWCQRKTSLVLFLATILFLMAYISHQNLRTKVLEF